METSLIKNVRKLIYSLNSKDLTLEQLELVDLILEDIEHIEAIQKKVEEITELLGGKYGEDI